MKRNTIQRQLTLDAVNAIIDHPTAEEVYDKIKLNYPDISKGTVYRNLKDLTQTGFISKISIPNTADRFDYIPEKHYHIRCVICEKLSDIDTEYMSELDEKIARLTGLDLESHDLFFNGICDKCRNEKRKRS